MISFGEESDQKNCLTIKTALAFFVNLFKKKKYKTKKSNVKETKNCIRCQKVPSVLSVSLMEMRMNSSSPLSPALSTITLTPGRTRDIDQDMEALRLSRQDNPFLQVLASRESLVESLFESESDDTNLMTQEFPSDFEVDPFSLPEIHEHMIRSPPPTTWPKSPNYKVFKFPDSEENPLVSNGQLGNFKKSMKTSSIHLIREHENSRKNTKINEKTESCSENHSAKHLLHSSQNNLESPSKRSKNDSKENLTNVLPIFRPTSLRSISDCRHLHLKNYSEDQSVKIVQQHFNDEAHLNIPFLSKKLT